jgi:hypothetical protein
MKAELSSIVDGIECQSDESQSYLNKLSGEVIIITDEEMNIAESNKDVSDYAEWMQEAINRATKYLEDQESYLELPTKYNFNEYRIMENFILTLPVEEQKNEMYSLIKGKGAFSKFRLGLDRFLLKEKWYEYRDNELIKFAKDWCKDNDVEIK